VVAAVVATGVEALAGADVVVDERDSSVISFHRVPFRPASDVHLSPGVNRIDVTWVPYISARPQSV